MVEVKGSKEEGRKVERAKTNECLSIFNTVRTEPNSRVIPIFSGGITAEKRKQEAGQIKIVEVQASNRAIQT